MGRFYAKIFSNASYVVKMKKSTPTRFGYVEVQVEIAVKPGR